MNLYRKDSVTFYDQVIEDNNLLRCWKEVVARSNLVIAKADAAEHNK